MDKKNKKKILKGELDNVILKNAGVKYKKDDYPTRDISSSSKYNYPCLYLNVENAPDLKGKEVGDKVVLVISGEITSHSKYERENKNDENFDISIKKIGVK